jgi:FAD-dependent oxidoreductase domain-containing protein 1
MADPGLEVSVVERDPTLARSSTMLSDGNVRVQFDLAENIEISRYGMQVLETFADDMAVDGSRPDVSLDRQGNLFLVPAEGEERARAALERQVALGAEVEWLDGPEIARRWAPYRSEVVGGTFGPRDGSVDPSAVVSGYRQAAARAGVEFVHDTASSILVGDGGVEGIVSAGGGIRKARAVVVAAGAWSTDLLATAGVEIPVDPIMRTVYVVRTDVGRGVRLPSVFLPSGVYVIPEHEDTFLVAWSRPDDPVGFDFTPAPRSRFYETIWPELVGVLPAFDRLEVVRSWAGLYAHNRLDANAIVGEWPGIRGLFQATGFSGHGYQQCHAVGRHLAELITGRPTTLDLSRLGPERVVANEPLFEHAGRII